MAQISWPRRKDGRPLAIAHRGAQAHAPGNTLGAFRIAAELGADMWELDLYLSADGVPFVSHDDDVQADNGVTLLVSQTNATELAKLVPTMPRFEHVVELAIELDQALYVDVKAPMAGLAALAVLKQCGFTKAALGSFNHAEVQNLVAAKSGFPIAVLVRVGEDPFALAEKTGADIIHLCWENAGPRPQDLMTDEMITRAHHNNLGIVLWHEERSDILADLVKLPVLGICTDQPELIGGFHSLRDNTSVVVCHRGINHIAPENTLASARLAYDLGCHYVELDVQMSRDGQIVVIHDTTVNRTTNGNGAVLDFTFEDLRKLDAGSWFSPFYAQQRLPSLEEEIALCKAHGKRLFIDNKNVPAKPLIELVERMGFLQDCFFWSDNMALMDDMRAASADVCLKVNAGQCASFEEMIERFSPGICEIELDQWEELSPQCRNAGIVPMLIYLGDDKAVFETIVQWQPDMINLDRADLLLHGLNSK